MRERHAREESTLRAYSRVARRRKWIILQAVVIAPVAAVLLSLRGSPVYSASAQVLLNQRNLSLELTQAIDPTVLQQPERNAQTQADIASVPAVAQSVIRKLRLRGWTIDEFGRSCSAAAKLDADLLTFTCDSSDRALTPRLATAYATAYTEYRRRLDTTAVQRARREVARRIEQLEAAGERRSDLYATLRETEQKLATMMALQSAPATVVRPATTATQVLPRPLRNAIMAVVLGLIAGVGLAVLREALDTRVRTADEVEALLDLPLLTRIGGESPRRRRDPEGLVMLRDPNGAQAESYRMLATSLELANLELRASTIIVTSAAESEGKSTTICNLGVALARAGKRVALVDLDLRQPSVHRLFEIAARPGITNIALGQVDIEEALVDVPVAEPDAESSGSLAVLTSGPVPPNAGEFVLSRPLAEILAAVRARADVVLVDSPPFLLVNDTLALTSHVEALVVVTRLGVAKRPALDELRRVLDSVPAPVLGFVLTGAERDTSYYLDRCDPYGSSVAPLERERVS